ncbi:DUF5615 family PIN-like protein [Halovenus salina]|uniref:DUF5615 family PIN-like protein n=1 Tax=Halovenus salina TaxID=1510225 RepID=A0ABD5VZ91_9EURY|nr:DUF5615 family PIN-like protein [Halovenus salina]
MSSTPELLLDEHVGRVFEHILRSRGYPVSQAKDRFGEHTSDRALLRWCGENETLLISNNAKDFEALHREVDHSGLLLYYDQKLPDEDPEGLARTVDAVLEQYGIAELSNNVVELDEWYEWLQ